MTFTGSVIREQGQSFAIVLVNDSVVSSPSVARDAIERFRPAFPGLPVVLAAQDARRRFTYFGRDDIAKFLASVNPRRIPWRKYHWN